MDLFGKEPRPVFNDEMLTELANAVGKEVCDWCDGETSLEDCIEVSKKILEFNYDEDGYALARKFEDETFSPDAQLVEILDNAAWMASDILNKAVKQWVIADKIEPPLKKGDTFDTKYGYDEIVKCMITGFNKETAEYLVACPSKGYPIEESARLIVKYENAIKDQVD